VAKSKRERKIGKVMGEFKEGTLKSGGSGRKVTNPKQAIAIALSEANAMNQGGMMYNEIMNRPMFQTPQMREGGGIMAGIAPIREYAEGGFADDLAESIRGFGDFLRNPEDSISPELYEALKTMTTEEAFTAAGAGTLGTAALTALMQLHPALRRMKGFKPKAKPDPRRGMSTQEQAEGFADPKSKTPMTATEQAEGLSQPRVVPKTAAPKKADAPETEGGIKSLGQRAATGIGGALRKGVGIGALTGATAYLLQMPIVQDLINQGFGIDELMEMPEIRALLGPDMDDYAEKRQEELLTDYAQSRLPDVATARKEGFPEQPKAPPPDPTFLDMLKGAGTQFKDFLQDPANQYAFAKAGQASEGIAPRNFASDFALGKEEYRQLEAQRENDTALMRNYQFLKETTDLSDKEIVSRLSNEATARDEFLTLFSETVDTAGSVTPEQIAQFEAITGYTLPEEARVRLGVAAPPSAVVE
jgi:hypothetical protein